MYSFCQFILFYRYLDFAHLSASEVIKKEIFNGRKINVLFFASMRPK